MTGGILYGPIPLNARQSKGRREREEKDFRANVLALVEAQNGVIGALVRQSDTLRKDIEELKQQMADVESGVMAVENP